MTSSACILLVDDEPSILECIGRTLERAGYQVLTARDGLEALSVLQAQPVDLILADIGMPRMNGYQLHQCVIEHPLWVTIPFMFVTARGHDSDIRYGKELGVDDYVVKPFVIEDLLAAVRGRLRRAQQLARRASCPGLNAVAASDSLVLGDLRINFKQHRVWRSGQPIRLSAREFKLLECLARRTDRVVPLTELIRVTHELVADFAEAGSLLRPLVRSLRRKLGYAAGDMGCIESVRGIGYRLIPPTD